MIKDKFKLNGREVQLELGYYIANETLPDLGLSIMTMFQEGNQVIQTILLNDAVMIKVLYHYVKADLGLEWIEFLHELDKTEHGLEKFKESFWNMVVGFSPPSVRNPLRKMWDEAKRQLKRSYESSSSPSSEELE